MSSAKNCLVFDLDGTISDPGSGIIRCYNHALQHHGYDTVDRGSLLKLIGPPLDVGFKTLVPTAGEEEIAGLVSAYRERYSAEGFSENEIYPGIAKALEQLKKCNVKMGICTSKRVDFAERILSLFEISDYFDFLSYTFCI